MLIEKNIEIDTGHMVPNHNGKCAAYHGHRYKIGVGVDDKVIAIQGDSSEGMVIDFSKLKEVMMNEIDALLDHTSIHYDKNDDMELLSQLSDRQVNRGKKPFVFVPFIPTAENIAKFIFEIMMKALEDVNIKISYIKVWETPTSLATYSIEDYKQENK